MRITARKCLAVVLALAELGIAPVFAADNDIYNDALVNDNECYVEVFSTSDIPSPQFDSSDDQGEDDSQMSLTDTISAAVKNYKKARENQGELYIEADIEKFNVSVSSGVIASAIKTAVYDEPEYFYVDCTRYIYSYSQETGNLTSVLIPMRYGIDETETRLAEFEAKANAVAEEIMAKATTELDRALLAHDYIVQNCKYDTESSKINTMTGHGADDVFMRGTAVCQGYASAYKYLLEYMGIECANAYNDKEGHEWSIVKIDGFYYHVDVTHDDPTPDRIGNVGHSYFLLTDGEIVQKSSHSSWDKQGTYICENSQYTNAPWRGAVTQIVYEGNYRYYGAAVKLSNGAYDTGIYRSDSYFSSAERIVPFISNSMYDSDLKVNIWGLLNVYSGLGLYNGALYFNSADAICSYDIASGSLTEVYKPSVESGNRIYGSRMDGNVIYYVEGAAVQLENGWSISLSDEVRQYTVEAAVTTPEPTVEPTTEPTPVPPPTEAPVELEQEITVSEETLKVTEETAGEKRLEGAIAVEVDGEAKKDDTVVYVGVYEDSVLKQILLKTLAELDENDSFDVSVTYDGSKAYTYKVFAWGGVTPYSLAYGVTFKED